MNSEQTAVASLTDGKTATIAKAAFLVATVVVSPLFLAQPVTGIFVNMALVLAAIFFGFGWESLLLAAIPSLIALLRGQLPVAFAILVPFIMIGNAILVASIATVQQKYGKYVLSVAIGSLLKAAFLALVAFTAAGTIFSGTPLAATVVTMFGWLQLLTALGGSALAYPLIRLSKRVFPKS
ncbi:MAG TPA: hypothetical protein VN420_04255 [Candidatus Fimivivens sp.]|nr:hypothetical protein [Candidatus Fimivivens sp.]